MLYEHILIVKNEIFFNLKLNSYQNLLSIIIPAYNAKKTLAKCIDSLIDQKTDWIEIIIIDDNSTDQSYKIYNKYKKIIEPKKFKVIYSNKNRGPGYSRNLGIKVSSGKYIAFLDSDDYFLDKTLIKLKKILLNFKPDILINNNLRNKKPFSNRLSFNFFKKNFIKKNDYLEISNKNEININECWKIIIKKTILSKYLIKFPEIYIGEDQCFVFDTILHSKTFFINKEPIIYHYSSPNGLSSSNLKLMTISFIFLLNYFYKKKGKSKLENFFIMKKVKYLEQNFNITSLNLNKKKLQLLLKKFNDVSSSKNFKALNDNFAKKILSNYENFSSKIKSTLLKDDLINRDIFIFSNNFLGKSLKKFINKNNQKIKYLFDDNPKFKLIELEKYNFNKKILNIFFLAITDFQSFKKIEKRIFKLNIDKKLIKLIKLF